MSKMKLTWLKIYFASELYKHKESHAKKSRKTTGSLLDVVKSYANSIHFTELYFFCRA